MKHKKNIDIKKKKPTGINLLSIQTNFFVKQKLNNIATNYKEVSMQMNYIKTGNTENTFGGTYGINTKHKPSKSKQTFKTSSNMKFIMNIASNNNAMSVNSNNSNSIGNGSQNVTNRINNNNHKASYTRTSHSIVHSMTGCIGVNNSNNNNNANITNATINKQNTNKTAITGITSYVLNNSRRQGSSVLGNNTNNSVATNNNNNNNNNVTKTNNNLSRLSLLIGNRFTNNNNNINNNNNKPKTKGRKCSINSVYLKLNDIINPNNNANKIITKRKESKKQVKKYNKIFAGYTKPKELNLFDENVHNKNQPKKINPKLTQQRNNLSLITDNMKYSNTELNNISSLKNNIPSQNLFINENVSSIQVNQSNISKQKVNKSSIMKFSLLSLIEENKQNLLNEKANHKKILRTFGSVSKKEPHSNEYDLSFIINNNSNNNRNYSSNINEPNLDLDNFDDLNSVVRILQVDKIDINKQSVFSVDNNHLYDNYINEFNIKFNMKFSQGKHLTPKLTNTSRSTQENSNKKTTSNNNNNNKTVL